jgi:hypothetical protein
MQDLLHTIRRPNLEEREETKAKGIKNIVNNNRKLPQS